MKKSGFVFLLGLFCLGLQQASHADSCTQVTELLAGEWQFNNTQTIKFEPGKPYVTLDDQQIAMSNCFAIPGINVSFFLHNDFVIIALPKQRQTSPRMIAGINQYNMTRKVSLAPESTPNARNVSQTGANPSNTFIVLPSQKYEEQFLVMKDSAIAQAFVEIANVVDPNLKIITKECGVINAWYSPQDRSITLCYDYLSSGDRFIDDSYRNESIEMRGTLTTGIHMSVLLHEFSHAVIDLRKIPIIGGEEDAADRIATIILLKFTEKNPTQGKLMIFGNLAFMWAIKTNALDKMLFGKNIYSDEHPITEQRVFNIMCLAYGSNPSLFSDMAAHFGLTSERALRCPNEYLAAKSAVHQLLK